MKYVTPQYEQAVIALKDIITASINQGSKYEIEQNDDRNGSVIMKALDLFK